MFSGLVEAVGRVTEITEQPMASRLVIECSDFSEIFVLGESISVSGTCLTVTEFGPNWFACQAVAETLRCTKLGRLTKNKRVNLERSLRLSDRLGGHLVTGHIDCLGKVENIVHEGASWLISFVLPAKWSPFFVSKGSVAIDGVSLTVADCDTLSKDSARSEFTFKVALIPHTLEATTLGELKAGDEVNVETDVIARYVARWLAPYAPGLVQIPATLIGEA